jgi:hypothetical protein
VELPQPDWFLSGPEVSTLHVEQVGYYLEHLIPKEGVVLLFGKYGSYKTPLTVNMAVAIASEPMLWGFEVTNTNVLYIEGDTPRSGIVPRIQKLPTLPANLDFAFVYPGIDVINPQTPDINAQMCSVLAAAHRQKKYGVVFVDSLRTSHQLPDKDSETPPRVYRAFARMFPGSTVFLIHHDRKTRPVERHMSGTQAEEEMMTESFSGSQAWINHATTGIKIQKHSAKEKQFITLIQTKNQTGVECSPIELKVTDGIHIEPVSALTDDMLTQALDMISWNSYVELDTSLAGFFGVSERWVREFRKKYETNVAQIPRKKR